MKRCGTHQSRCLWCTSTVRVLVSHPPGGRQSCVYTQMNKVRLSRRPIVRVATVYMIETMNIRILVKVYTGENAQARNAGLCARCIRTPPEAPPGQSTGEEHFSWPVAVAAVSPWPVAWPVAVAAVSPWPVAVGDTCAKSFGVTYLPSLCGTCRARAPMRLWLGLLALWIPVTAITPPLVGLILMLHGLQLRVLAHGLGVLSV